MKSITLKMITTSVKILSEDFEEDQLDHDRITAMYDDDFIDAIFESGQCIITRKKLLKALKGDSGLVGLFDQLVGEEESKDDCTWIFSPKNIFEKYQGQS